MITITIVDDESLVASSLATLLGLEADLEVVAVCSSGEEILTWWRERQAAGQRCAEVCVLDLQLGGMDSLDTAVALQTLTAHLPVLIVTSPCPPLTA